MNHITIYESNYFKMKFKVMHALQSKSNFTFNFNLGELFFSFFNFFGSPKSGSPNFGSPAFFYEK